MKVHSLVIFLALMYDLGWRDLFAAFCSKVFALRKLRIELETTHGTFMQTPASVPAIKHCTSR